MFRTSLKTWAGLIATNNLVAFVRRTLALDQPQLLAA